MYTCAHFGYKMVHCRIWDWCIVRFVWLVYGYWALVSLGGFPPRGFVKEDRPTWALPWGETIKPKGQLWVDHRQYALLSLGLGLQRVCQPFFMYIICLLLIIMILIMNPPIYENTGYPLNILLILDWSHRSKAACQIWTWYVESDFYFN